MRWMTECVSLKVTMRRCCACRRRGLPSVELEQIWKLRNCIAASLTEGLIKLGNIPAMIAGAGFDYLPDELEALACAMCLGLLSDAVQQAYLCKDSEPPSTFSKCKGWKKTRAGDGGRRLSHILGNRMATSLKCDAQVAHSVAVPGHAAVSVTFDMSAYNDIAKVLE